MEESLAGPIPTSSVEDSREESVSKAGATKPGEVTIEQTTSKQISRKLYEQAVDDAQYLMAYASSKCPKDINRDTIESLIQARQRVENKQEVNAKEEADFWLAYQDIWKLVSPVTAECIKATESPSARRTIKRYIIFTVSVLILMLVIQIYWVIGNQISTQLAGLLQRETELSKEINANQKEYSAIEIRFKQNEWDAENFQGFYEYLYSPEFERDTAENLSVKARLEMDLADLKSQLERNSTILRTWSKPWQWLIPPTSSEREGELEASIKRNESEITRIEQDLNLESSATTKIQEIQTEIKGLEGQLAGAPEDKIPELELALGNLYSEAYYLDQLNGTLQSLKDDNAYLELQKTNLSIKEESNRAYLAAQFVLVILQSYLLPLLYGILGAGTSVLRSLSKEIDQVVFSEKRAIQHLLRISLGALAGIMAGWFSFLIDNGTTSFLGSVSPLAIAFLVGYNIEFFFSKMDTVLNRGKEAGQQSVLTQEEQRTMQKQVSTSLAKRERTSREILTVKDTSKQILPAPAKENGPSAQQKALSAPLTQAKPDGEAPLGEAPAPAS